MKKPAYSIPPSDPEQGWLTALWTVFDTAIVPMVALDLDGKILRSNQQFAVFIGHPLSGLTGSHWSTLVIPLGSSLLASSAHLLRREASRLEIEQSYLHRDNSVITCPTTLSVASDTHGQPLCLIVQIHEYPNQRAKEIELSESARRYRDIVENISDCLFLLDVTEDGHFLNLDINPAFEVSTGLARADLVGKCIDEAFPTETAHLLVEACRHCLTGGATTDEELAVVLPSGKRHYHVKLVPIRNDSGRIHRIAGITRDITDQKKAEAFRSAQMELETRLIRLAELAPGAICTVKVDTNGASTMPYASPKLREVCGIDPTSVAHNTSALIAIIHPNDLSLFLYSIAESARSLMPWRNEFRLLHPEKGEVWLEGQGTPEKEKDGSITWYGFIHDVTERRRTEDTLRMTSFALNSVGKGIYLVDDLLRIRYVNDEACLALGYRRDELLRMGLCDIDTESNSQILKAIALQSKENSPVILERIHRRKDGSTFPVEVHTTPFSFGGQEFSISLARDITQRKALEAELEYERAQLKALLRTIPDPVWLKDPQGRFLVANTAFETLFNAGPGELIGKTDFDFVPPEQASFFQRKDQEAIEAGGLRVNEEWVRYAKDGRMALWETIKTPLSMSDGEIIGVLGVARDITEHRQLEEELRTRHRYQRALLDNFPFLVWLKDTETRFLTVNQAFAKGIFCENDIECLIGRTDFDIFPEHLARGYNADDLEVMHTGCNKIVEEIVPILGELRWFETYKAPVLDESGKLLGTVGFARDITERREAERRLHDSEQAFRALVENSPDSIVRYDTNCRRVYANPVMASILGIPADQLLGKHFSVDSPLIDHATYERKVLEVFASGRDVMVEMPFRNTRGELRYSHFRIVPEFAPCGDIVSVLSIGRDVTDAREKERQLLTLMESIPDYIARFDQEGRHLYVNPALARALGSSTEGCLSKTLNDFPSTNRKQNTLVIKSIRKTFDSGEARTLEYVLPTTTGDKVFEVRCFPERDVIGKIISVLGIAHDISGLREAQLNVLDRERIFRTLAENLPDGLVRYDRHCRALYANPTMFRMDYFDAETIVGSTPMESCTQGHLAAQAYQSVLEEVIATGRPQDLEISVSFSVSKSSIYHMSFVAEKHPSGEIIGALAIGRDITTLKTTLEHLEASRAEIRELAAKRESAREEERKRIARELHDDLGQYLTALRLRVGTLRYRAGEQDPFVVTCTNDMISLVDRTLQVVRHVAASLRPAVLDLGISSALDWLIGEFSDRSRTRFHLSVKPCIKKLSEDQATTVFRIVQESLTNITRHAHAKHAFVNFEKPDGEYLLEIWDDGKGFVFTGRSTSFGLLGIKERVQLLKGKVDIESSPGQGTCIRVIFPESGA